MNPSIPCWAIVPATGVGLRMASDRPKQYLQLGSKTILELTLNNLLSHPAIDGLVLVLNSGDEYWGRIDYSSAKPLLTCEGGKERHHSVRNGLNRLSGHLHTQDAMVLIHDAVRPFVLHEDITRLIQTAELTDDGAILAVPVADTLKRANDDQAIQQTTSRQNLWRAFTPQAFRLSLIQAALERIIQAGDPITDDASAMELQGYRPRLVESDGRNIKITHPQDLQLARIIFDQGLQS